MIRDAGRAGVGGAMPLPQFWADQLTYSNQGTNYAYHISTAPPLQIFGPSATSA